MTDIEKIICRLLELTEERQIKWGQTNISNQYEVAIGSGSILVTYKNQFQKILLESSYTAKFYNDNGDEIGRYEYNGEANSSKSILKNLYEEIERSYLKTQETLDDMKRHLGIEEE